MKTILILLLISFTVSEQIIPDPNYPVMLKFATSNASLGNTLILKFQLPTRQTDNVPVTASGISYMQYIGVTFPNSLFTFTSSSVTCTLSSSTTTYSVKFAAPITSNISSTSANGNIAYCQLVDSINNSLPANTTLTLTLILPTNFSASFINSIGLFTSTSNQADQLIIDYIPVLGSIAQYIDYTTAGNNLNIISISSTGSNVSTITTPSNPPSTTTIYPYYVISVTIQVTVNSFNFPTNHDFTFLFQWDQTSFTKPTGISSSAVSTTTADEGNLTTTLTSTYSTDGMILTGFSDQDLYPNRSFLLTFSGMIVNDVQILTQTYLSFSVNYLSTYSTVSYSKLNMDKVNQIGISATLIETEQFTVFDGMAWPFNLKFNPTSDITSSNGGYVVIRHQLYSLTSTNFNAFTFVASSCDFSDNSTLTQDFGKRWNCYPLKNNFNYSAGPDGLSEGSGIFFYMSSMLSANTFSLKFWGFIERCYNSTVTGLTYNGARLYFTIRFYKTISNTALDEAKFTADPVLWKNYVIAQNLSVELAQKCYPLQVFNPSVAGAVVAGVANNLTSIASFINNAAAPTNVIGVEYNNIFASKVPTVETTLSSFGEYGNKFIMHDPRVFYPDPAGVYPEQFFFSSSGTNIGGNSLLFFNIIRADDSYDTSAPTTYLMNYIPSECKAITGTYSISGAKIQWFFSRLWFTQGNKLVSGTTGCQVSWKILQNQDDYTSNIGSPIQSSLFQSANNSITSISIQTGGAATSYQLDNVNSTIDTTTGATTPFQISSLGFGMTSGVQPIVSAGSFNALSMLGVNCNSPIKHNYSANSTNGYYFSAIIQMGIYTNCIKWVTQPSTVKSLFGYFDVQALLLDGTGIPFRVWRFIKLYPEPGILQDATQVGTPISSDYAYKESSWVIGHYSLTNYNYSPTAVCIIEISSKVLNDAKTDSTANTLILWLFATSLLDVDYTVNISAYPAAPLPNSVVAYANHSGHTISAYNRTITSYATSTFQGTNTNYTSQLERYWYRTTSHYSFITGVPFYNSFNATHPGRTLYHFYMGSIIYIYQVSSNITGTQSPTQNAPNLYIPYYCNSSADTGGAYASGVYFTYPIVTAAWANMSNYETITKLSTYILPTNTSTKTTIQIFSDTKLDSWYISHSNTDTTFVQLYTYYNTILLNANLIQSTYIPQFISLYNTNYASTINTANNNLAGGGTLTTCTAGVSAGAATACNTLISAMITPSSLYTTVISNFVAAVLNINTALAAAVIYNGQINTKLTAVPNHLQQAFSIVATFNTINTNMPKLGSPSATTFQTLLNTLSALTDADTTPSDWTAASAAIYTAIATINTSMTTILTSIIPVVQMMNDILTIYNNIATAGGVPGGLSLFTTLAPYQVPLFKAGTSSFWNENPKIVSLGSTNGLNFFQLNVYFSDYTQSESTLNLVLSSSFAAAYPSYNSPVATTKIYTSSIGMFLNSSVGAISSVTGNLPFTTGSSEELQTSTTSSLFYIVGKPFNRFLATSISDSQYDLACVPLITCLNYASFQVSSTPYTISGIPNIPISNLNSTYNANGYNSLLNYIAIYMNHNLGATQANVNPAGDVSKSSNTIITNYIIGITNLSSGTLLADFVLFYPDDNATATWTNLVLVNDITTESYNNDSAGNLLIQATLPSMIPIGGIVTFGLTSGTILGNGVSVCGLMENSNGITTNCTIGSNTSVSCTLTVMAPNVSICCYNIYNLSSTLPVTLLTGDVSLSPPIQLSQTTPQIMAVTESIYTLSVDPKPTYIIPSITDITNSSFYASIDNIIYTISSTIGGFGQALFQITLPRAPTRGMTIQIMSDFKVLLIPNIKPTIIPTFGTNALYGSHADDGDIFLDSVYTNFDQNGLTIKLKNIIYKCGITLSRNLSIYMYPIQTVNITNLSLSIIMKSANSQLLAAQTPFLVSSNPVLTLTPVDTTIHSDLFTVSVFPAIVEEIATYTFTIDLKTESTEFLQSDKPNEITIVFSNAYPDNMNVICDNGTTGSTSVLECNFDNKQFLNIRYPNLPITGAVPFVINVSGIMNPNVSSSNSIYFAMSINETDFIGGTRRSTVLAQSSMLGFTTATNLGNIRMLNGLTLNTSAIPISSNSNGVATSSSSVNGSTTTFTNIFNEVVTPLNPRDNPSLTNPSYSTLHQFAFTIDYGLSMTSASLGTSISNPVLLITFPPEYHFTWFTFTISGIIEAFEVNSVDNYTIEQYTSVTIKSITSKGNQIWIYFNETSLTINKYHQYFLLSLFGIPVPTEVTVNTATGNSTTGNFKFLIINDPTLTNSTTSAYRSWTNLITFTKEPNLTVTDPLISYYRGFKFDYDQTKWVIDIIDSTDNLTNALIVRPGRYLTYSFVVRTMNSFLNANVAQLQLKDDPVFNLLEPYYTVSTSDYSPVPFQIGAPCGTDPANYITLITYIQTSTNIYNYFMPISPINAMVMIDTLGTIQFQNSYNVKIGGSTYIYFTLSEPTVSEIDVVFTNSSDSTISGLKLLAGTSLARTTISMLDDSTNIQTYTLGASPNSCYQYQYNSIAFYIDGYVAIIPNEGINQSMFEFFNSAMDSSITDLDSVKFIFNSDYVEIYVYAVLTCISMEFPSDDDILAGNITQSPTLAYFSDIISTSGKYNIMFNNLLRGESYQLRVIVESTQGNTTERTYSHVVMQNYTLSNGTVINLMPTPTQPFSCASYAFQTRPGIQVTNPLLWYWQNKFSSSGYESSGCVNALDQYGTDIPGLPSIKNQTLCSTSTCIFQNYEQYIVNQTSTSDSEVYTICPVPYKNCATDPPSYDEKFNEAFTELNTNQTFLSILNINVVPQFTLSQITDKTPPSSPSISGLQATTNQVTFSVTASQGGSTCTALLATSTPLSSNFASCTNCIAFTASNVTSTESIAVSGQTGSVSVYAQCSNPIPCSTNSIIVNLGSVTIPTTSTNNTTNGTSSQNNNTSSGNATFISFNLIIIVLMSLFLY